MFTQNALYLDEKVLDQLGSIGKHVGTPGIVNATMPVIMFGPGLREARAARRNAMCVVEPEKPPSVRTVQCECVTQTVRPFTCLTDAHNLELEPIALFEVMNAAIKVQQKFECVFAGNDAPLIAILL